MNTLESYTGENPFGESAEYAKFTIDEASTPFTLNDVSVVGQQYTLSFWVKSEVESTVTANGIKFASTTKWQKHVLTYIADSVNATFLFGSTGIYYIYHPQLELGNKATDWTPAVEDMATGEDVDNVESNLEGTNDRLDELDEKFNEASLTIDGLNAIIEAIVQGENGRTMLTQTDTGWTFSMQPAVDAVNNSSEVLRDLKSRAEALEKNNTETVAPTLEKFTNLNGFVWIDFYKDEPAIFISRNNGSNGLIVTSDRIIFVDEDTNNPTYVDDDELSTHKISIKKELRQNGFVWAKRNNGNYGLSWKGDN